MSEFDRAPMYSLPPRIKLELACLTDEEIHFWQIPIRKLFEVILYLKNTSEIALIWNIFDSMFGLAWGKIGPYMLKKYLRQIPPHPCH